VRERRVVVRVEMEVLHFLMLDSRWETFSLAKVSSAVMDVMRVSSCTVSVSEINWREGDDVPLQWFAGAVSCVEVLFSSFLNPIAQDTFCIIPVLHILTQLGELCIFLVELIA
jgi:hypothetical protein